MRLGRSGSGTEDRVGPQDVPAPHGGDGGGLARLVRPGLESGGDQLRRSRLVQTLAGPGAGNWDCRVLTQPLTRPTFGPQTSGGLEEGGSRPARGQT